MPILKNRCYIAFRTEDFSLLRAIYEQAKALPTTATVGDFLTVNGYAMDGQLFKMTSCKICFKAGLPHVMKISTQEEYSRAILFVAVLTEHDTTMQQNIISMDPVTKNSKYCIFMPLHPITLEHL